MKATQRTVIVQASADEALSVLGVLLSGRNPVDTVIGEITLAGVVMLEVATTVAEDAVYDDQGKPSYVNLSLTYEIPTNETEQSVAQNGTIHK